eukprot:3713342-Prymnesium_polylepis.1
MTRLYGTVRREKLGGCLSSARAGRRSPRGYIAKCRLCIPCVPTCNYSRNEPPRLPVTFVTYNTSPSNIMRPTCTKQESELCPLESMSSRRLNMHLVRVRLNMHLVRVSAGSTDYSPSVLCAVGDECGGKLCALAASKPYILHARLTASPEACVRCPGTGEDVRSVPVRKPRSGRGAATAAAM